MATILGLFSLSVLVALSILTRYAYQGLALEFKALKTKCEANEQKIEELRFQLTQMHLRLDLTHVRKHPKSN